MAFNQNLPADNEVIAAAPAIIRENDRALEEDKIVNAGKLLDLVPGNATGNIPISNGTLCTNLNAEKVGGKAVAELSLSGHTHSNASTTVAGFMSAADKTNLDVLVAASSSGFSTITCSAGTTIVADSASDTLDIVGSGGITATGDNTNDRLTLTVTDGGITDTKIGNRTVDQALAGGASTGTLTQLLSWHSKQLKAISGATNWYDAPATTLAALNSGKQATITGAATTIASSNLTASRALASDASGKVAVSAVTATELGYLSGTTSSVQTQLTAAKARSLCFTTATPANGWMSAPIRIPAAMTLTYVYANCNTAPTSAVTINVYKNGVSIGNFSLSTTSASYDIADTALVAGDVVKVGIPGNTNTIAGLAVQLAMTV